MQLRRLGLAVACAAAGYVVRAGTEPAAAAPRPVEVARTAAVPPPPAIAVACPPVRDTTASDLAAAAAAATPDDAADPREADDLGDAGDADDAGEDVAELLAHAAAAHPAATYDNHIHGVVTDAHNGEMLAGVTVIATSPGLEGSRVAISDERGDYMFSDLPPGNYLLTFYYAQVTVEHPGLGMGSFTELEVPQQIDQEWIINIPVPARTFEATLGEASGSSEGDGVSFSGSDTLENSYYIDGVAVSE